MYLLWLHPILPCSEFDALWGSMSLLNNIFFLPQREVLPLPTRLDARISLVIIIKFFRGKIILYVQVLHEYNWKEDEQTL